MGLSQARWMVYWEHPSFWKMNDDNWLVVWLPFFIPYIGNNHPNWLSYFSEGWPNHQADKRGYSCFRKPMRMNHDFNGTWHQQSGFDGRCQHHCGAVPIVFLYVNYSTGFHGHWVWDSAEAETWEIFVVVDCYSCDDPKGLLSEDGNPKKPLLSRAAWLGDPRSHLGGDTTKLSSDQHWWGTWMVKGQFLLNKMI